MWWDSGVVGLVVHWHGVLWVVLGVLVCVRTHADGQ